REDVPGDKRLVAYVVSEQPELDVAGGGPGPVGGVARDKLASASFPPGALAPAPPGTLDAPGLPAPAGAAFGQRKYEEPQGAIESALAQIWSELLQVERIGRQDHFFELGGHSLLAVQLMERMRCQGLCADVRTLFTQPTLMGLAANTKKVKEVVF